LWDELTASAPAPAARVLIEEACRIADRLDRLDRILTGSDAEWMRFQVADDGDVTVIIGAPLAEARQQATALKAILAELRQSTAAPATAEEGSILDQLAARRKARLANTAGQ